MNARAQLLEAVRLLDEGQAIRAAEVAYIASVMMARAVLESEGSFTVGGTTFSGAGLIEVQPLTPPV